jgi:hypothetical protein
MTTEQILVAISGMISTNIKNVSIDIINWIKLELENKFDPQVIYWYLSNDKVRYYDEVLNVEFPRLRELFADIVYNWKQWLFLNKTNDTSGNRRALSVYNQNNECICRIPVPNPSSCSIGVYACYDIAMVFKSEIDAENFVEKMTNVSRCLNTQGILLYTEKRTYDGNTVLLLSLLQPTIGYITIDLIDAFGVVYGREGVIFALYNDDEEGNIDPFYREGNFKEVFERITLLSYKPELYSENDIWNMAYTVGTDVEDKHFSSTNHFIKHHLYQTN